MKLSFTHTRTQRISWENEHGTHRRANVTRILPIAAAGDAYARWRRVGDVLCDVVGRAFQFNEPLRADGSRWSLNQIGVPQNWALSLAAHDVLEQVPPSWLSAAYQAELATRDRMPMLISGSMKIGRINRFLALRDMALSTSGASDGQTLAGCASTGTHGAAIGFGALHDCFSAIHLMVGPKRAVLIQPSSKPLLKASAASLTSWLGFPTELVGDDAIFEAALVGLGSMGLVLNVIVEVEPLYFLTSVTTAHRDDKWWDVLATRSTAGISGHPSHPWHLEVLATPYEQRPKSAPRAWVKSMIKSPYQDQPDVEIDPSHPRRPNPDLIGLVADAAHLLDCGMSSAAFRSVITKQMVQRYGSGKTVRRALPGVMFGPTTLPKGQGQSIEFAVEGGLALHAAETLFSELETQLRKGRQLLGGVGIRFVGQSRATLAPNTKAPTCFIELPTVRTNEISRIYEACGKALHRSGIPFGCHWGQYLTGTRESLGSYFTEAQKRSFISARKKLLKTEKARRIFASPILGPSGLE